MNALVISKINYCNILYVGHPLRLAQRWQWFQNAAAKLMKCVSKFDHISPGMAHLHWLPVMSWIRFKVLVLLYKKKPMVWDSNTCWSTSPQKHETLPPYSLRPCCSRLPHQGRTEKHLLKVSLFLDGPSLRCGISPLESAPG